MKLLTAILAAAILGFGLMSLSNGQPDISVSPIGFINTGPPATLETTVSGAIQKVESNFVAPTAMSVNDDVEGWTSRIAASDIWVLAVIVISTIMVIIILTDLINSRYGNTSLKLGGAGFGQSLRPSLN